MRNFVLAKNVAMPTTGAVAASTAYGAVGVAALANGILTFQNGSTITDKGSLVLVREAAKGGNVILPIYKNHFSYVKGTYVAASAFAASIVIPAPSSDGIFTLTAVKKGVKFNERSNFAAVVPVKSGDTAAAVAQKIKDYFDKNNIGLTVTLTTATLSFAGVAGQGWKLVPGDDLFGTTVTVTTEGLSAYGDAAYVADLAAKAAADAGFEYTYQDDVKYLYPDYPLNPLRASDAADTGFTIFTLRFAEPREVKTVDELVHQIIQVAFPTGAAGITAFENACKYLSDISVG